MTMTRLTTMTWPSLAARQMPAITAVRTTYINEQVSLGKTNGNWNDLSDTVTNRIWLDQTSAEAWAAFISQTATDNGTTCSVVITDIGQ